jgi:tRNA nucleotidyltransferase (CCA-adding enzyme)
MELLQQIPDSVFEICKRLAERNKRAWIVGGCVRDLLRGGKAKDWDIATDARPEEVMASFKKVIPTGIDHGTVSVLIRGVPFEVTTLRGEGAYTDGRRPDSVEFVSDIVADLARRDFTMNAIAVDPVGGAIIDPFGGERDLANRLVRAVGDPNERFAEDGLRVLRGARFAATLECSIEEDTLRAMGSDRSLATFRRVSAERVREEWMKAMHARKPSVAFDVMLKTNLLGITCPELLESVGCEQNKWHAYDVWGHAMACLDACDAGPVVRIAALFHDIGKPRSRAYSDKTRDYTFHEHERIGAEMVAPILARMKFSNDERSRIVSLVRHHLICYSEEWSDAAVRRWIRRVSLDLAPDLYALGAADALGKGREAESDLERLKQLRARVDTLVAAGAALSPRDLALRGDDLMRTLGLSPSKIIGETLEHLVEVVTDDPSANERERLLEAAKAFLEARAERDAATKP